MSKKRKTNLKFILFIVQTKDSKFEGVSNVKSFKNSTLYLGNKEILKFDIIERDMVSFQVNEIPS